MIVKDAQFGNTKGVTVVLMGKGDVYMVSSKRLKTGGVCLCFKTVKEPKPINVNKPSDYDSFDEMEPELAFMFSATESIDAVISMLELCKNTMNEKK